MVYEVPPDGFIPVNIEARNDDFESVSFKVSMQLWSEAFFLIILRVATVKLIVSGRDKAFRCLLAKATWWIKCNYNYNIITITILYYYNYNITITITIKLQPISGRADGASATETVDLGSIPDRVKPKTTKIDIYSFPCLTYSNYARDSVKSPLRLW